MAANSVTADKLAVGVGGLPATAVVLSEYEVNPNLLNAGFVPTGVFSTNVGWISLSNAVARVQTDILLPGVDSDGDGIPDAWEMKYFGNLTTATASSDRDGDGVSDLAEYLADTDPTDSASRLRIKSIETGTDGSPVALTWPSRSSRCYYIQKAGDLNTPINWLDSGLGLILPDAGDETSRKLLDPAAPMRFFRIEAVKPLTP